MAQQMAKLFEELGGKIHYHAEVKQIKTSNGKTEGIGGGACISGNCRCGTKQRIQCLHRKVLHRLDDS